LALKLAYNLLLLGVVQSYFLKQEKMCHIEKNL